MTVLQLTVHPVEILLRVLVVYSFLYILIRALGKRHVGQLAPFDLLMLLILSECVQNAMLAGDNSLVAGLLAAAGLLGLNYAVGHMSRRFKGAERILEGRPTLLVRNGQVYKAALIRENVTRAELLEALRKQGCSSIRSVRYAMLETDGKISVGLRAAAQKE